MSYHELHIEAFDATGRKLRGAWVFYGTRPPSPSDLGSDVLLAFTAGKAGKAHSVTVTKMGEPITTEQTVTS